MALWCGKIDFVKNNTKWILYLYVFIFLVFGLFNGKFRVFLCENFGFFYGQKKGDVLFLCCLPTKIAYPLTTAQTIVADSEPSKRGHCNMIFGANQAVPVLSRSGLPALEKVSCPQTASVVPVDFTPDPSTNEILDDRTSTGRLRPWREFKLANELLSAHYEEVDPSKAERLRNCATYLAYQKSGADGQKTLYHAFFCRVRLCPVCQWRRALKTFSQTDMIMKAMTKNAKYRFLFLTLTIENCSPDKLSETIDLLMAAWGRMSRFKAFSVVEGWYRGLEVTHNVKRKSPSYNTYHPHFHVLLAVKPSYFSGREYLSHEDWMKLWKKALRVSYDPSVRVRAIKGVSIKAVAEAVKYTVKPSDYIVPKDWDLSVESIYTLDHALANRRLVAYGGVMSDWHRKLHLDDPDDGDLVNVGDDVEQGLTAEDLKLVTYGWYSGYRQYYREKDR